MSLAPVNPHQAVPQPGAVTASSNAASSTGIETAGLPAMSTYAAVGTTSVQAQAVPVASGDPVAPLNPVTAVVASVLGWVMSPFVTTSPVAPTESPAMWALLAWARRESSGSFVNDAQTARPVQVVFNPEARDKTLSPFPSNIFTVGDPGQYTGLRVTLPLPDPTARPSDHADMSVINTLDGFNITPRISIPFTGEIDLSTVNSKTVFLQKLGSTVPGDDGPGADRVGINQVVWDTATTTLHVTANDTLDEHTRYVLVVTSGVKDKNGNPIESEEFERFRHDLNFGQTNDPRLKDYRKELLDALAHVRKSGVKTKDVVVASVFTTRSVTTELEKIREQIYAAPAPTVHDYQAFQLDSLTDITFSQQNRTAGPLGQPVSFINLLRSTPGIGTVAFGKYVSPDYRTAQNVIPATPTKTGAPVVLGQNEITFDLYLPSGTPPPGGWPVAIVGHGATGHKQNSTPVTMAAALAQQGIATIAINAPGNGFGPASTVTVTRSDGSTVAILSGGRGKDTNNDTIFGLGEGASAAFFPIRDRDRVRQTAVDLMQLVRVIDAIPDVDASRIYYTGQSLGGLYGAVFVAVEPRVRAAALNVPFPFLGTLLSPTRGRPAAGAALAARNPSLINSPGIEVIDGVPVNFPAVGAKNFFNENLPLRDQPPVINTIPGAMAIQEVFDNTEWVQQSGGALGYAALLRSSDRPILVQVAKGDQIAPNPLASQLIRAGDFADTTTFYRHDLAEAINRGLPNDPHDFLNQTLGSVPGNPGATELLRVIARSAQQQIAVFLASDGHTIIDPDTVIDPAGSSMLFEAPIPLPLSEKTNFISTP